MQNRENLTINEITEAIIGAAIEVHRTLGPGLLESAYQECLARELTLRQIAETTAAGVQRREAGMRLSS